MLQHYDAGHEYEQRVVGTLHRVQRLHLDLAAAVAHAEVQVVDGQLAGVLLVVDDGSVLLLCYAHAAAVVVVECVELIGVLGEHFVVGGHELDSAGEGERVGGGGSGGRRRGGRGGGSSGVGVGVHLDSNMETAASGEVALVTENQAKQESRGRSWM